MPNNGKYRSLDQTTGQETLESAIQSSAGSGDSGKITGLDSTGRLDSSFMPVGVAPDVKIALASENLGASTYVNLFNNSGTINARLADKSNGRPAHGFVLSAVTSGANATVFFEGRVTGFTGLTPGARQYLSTAGARTETAQTTGLHQFLGIAIDATSIDGDIDDHVVLN